MSDGAIWHWDDSYIFIDKTYMQGLPLKFGLYCRSPGFLLLCQLAQDDPMPLETAHLAHLVHFAGSLLAPAFLLAFDYPGSQSCGHGRWSLETSEDGLIR